MFRFVSFPRCSDFNEPWRLRHELKDKHHRQAGTTPTHIPRRRSQGRCPAQRSRPARRSQGLPGSGPGSGSGSSQAAGGGGAEGRRAGRSRSCCYGRARLSKARADWRSWGPQQIHRGFVSRRVAKAKRPTRRGGGREAVVGAVSS